MLETIITQLKTKFDLENIHLQRNNLAFVTIEANHAVHAIEYLKNYMGYKHFVLLTAVDYLEDNKFQLTYLLNNPESHNDIGVRVLIPRDHAVMESSHLLWPTVATYQRELNEMFGIYFPGSPRIEEPFILEGWEGTPPYRRDFKTKEFAQQFYHQREGRSTNDPATYMKEKLYPNE